MPYVEPPALAPGVAPSSTDWNTYVRGNLEYFKTVDGSFGNPPACRVNRSTAQTISTGGTGTVIVWDTEEHDTDGMWSSGSAITIQTAGLYVVSGFSMYASNSTGVRQTGIRLNSSATISALSCNAVSGAQTVLETTTVRKFSAGDTVELIVFQSSGGNLDVQNTVRPYLSVAWLGTGV